MFSQWQKIKANTEHVNQPQHNHNTTTTQPQHNHKIKLRTQASITLSTTSTDSTKETLRLKQIHFEVLFKMLNILLNVVYWYMLYVSFYDI